jgi:hypothetical protein
MSVDRGQRGAGNFRREHQLGASDDAGRAPHSSPDRTDLITRQVAANRYSLLKYRKF